MKNRKTAGYVLMHILFLIYSLTSVISRKTGAYELFSLEFFVGYGLVFLCLGIYALGWQQVLKIFPLAQAYTNKAIVVIWGILWGRLLFGEEITAAKLIGAGLIVCGVILFASEGEKREEAGR
ncbi:MAG: transporter [Clostridia bacterium]|nr:transporter [Clostridia bacterium]